MDDRAATGVAMPDPARAIEIAERVWWVGHFLEGDSFQCHVYLLEHGEDSVLFDPGSALTFAHTLRKIEQVTAFSSIRYFVCHHQDPDITGVLPLIDRMVARDDAVIVTHWRAEALLKHYALRLPFWRVDAHDWQLDLGGRELRFVFTPYAHFPGAFVTFDTATGTLFSSDLFGGFTEGFSLFAEDESYFDRLRPFHEHYIPSRDILQHALSAIEPLPLTQIAPQHGSIIPGYLIPAIVKRLRHLDCGLFLLSRENTDVKRLMELNRALKDITETMMVYRDFKDIAQSLTTISRRLLPVERLEFHVRTDDDAFLHLTPENRYRGRLSDSVPDPVAGIMAFDREGWMAAHGRLFRILDPAPDDRLTIAVPLFSPDRGRADSVALIYLTQPVAESDDLDDVISQIEVPLQVAVERETIYRTIDLERQKFYEASIRDPLTNLFTRYYMEETMRRQTAIHDRDKNAAIGVIMVDVDHFKSINDTFGHNQGDTVLRTVAKCLLDTVRPGDLPVRYGGEEFAIFIVGANLKGLADQAERLRLTIAALQFADPMEDRRITASLGLSIRHQGECLVDFVDRADQALYAAKQGGRNQVCQGVP